MACPTERSFSAAYADVYAQIHAVLVDTARHRRFVSYSDLVRRVKAFPLRPDDPRLHGVLGDISRAEDAAGRGLQSIVVVHKTGDMMPGKGFFDLARFLGRDVADAEKFWSKEVAHVFAAWKG